MRVKAGWMTGSMLGVALLASGAAAAQTQPGYPRANDQQAQDEPYADEDVAAPREEENAAPQGQYSPDEDFSDVTGAEQQPQERAGNSRRFDTPEQQDDTYREDRGEGEEVAMTDACALAARDEAERDGGYAEVRQMQAPRESRNGFSIDGDVETRSGWRAQDGRLRHFTCTIANGRIQDVRFQRERAAR